MEEKRDLFERLGTNRDSRLDHLGPFPLRQAVSICLWEFIVASSPVSPGYFASVGLRRYAVQRQEERVSKLLGSVSLWPVLRVSTNHGLM